MIALAVLAVVGLYTGTAVVMYRRWLVKIVDLQGRGELDTNYQPEITAMTAAALWPLGLVIQLIAGRSAREGE